jgi:hypothetical protein
MLYIPSYVHQRRKKSAVRIILQSREFKDSPVYTNLLSYLLDSVLSHTIPKETTVAIDVFGKDPAFNSNKDSTVRYHMHMLRKKLDDYYKNEGKNDKLKLFLPTGHYEIQFTSSRIPSLQKSVRIATFLKQWQTLAMAAFLLVIALLAALLVRSGQPGSLAALSVPVDVDDKIWGSFFSNGNPIDIIIGDDFLMDEYNPELRRYRQIRDWKIDSESDMSVFLNRHPKQNLWRSEITGIPFGGMNNLMDIFPIVFRFQRDVSLKMSSGLSLEEIRNRNIIYMGEFKNLRVLDKIISKTPVRFQYHPDERLFLLGDRGDTVQTFVRIEAPYEQKNKYNVDYSLIVKIPGFTSENFLFVVGFGYGGRLERTKMLADPSLRAGLVENIRKMNGTVPDYFIVLFEVKSIERTGFTNDVRYFKEISKDFFRL